MVLYKASSEYKRSVRALTGMEKLGDKSNNSFGGQFCTGIFQIECHRLSFASYLVDQHQLFSQNLVCTLMSYRVSGRNETDISVSLFILNNQICFTFYYRRTGGMQYAYCFYKTVLGSPCPFMSHSKFMSEKPSGMNIGITSYKSVFQVQSNLSSILYMYSLFTVSKALESEN